MAVISMLNSVILDIEPDRGKDLPFGAKTHKNTERTVKMESLEAELNDLQVELQNLSQAWLVLLSWIFHSCVAPQHREDQIALQAVLLKIQRTVHLWGLRRRNGRF